MTFPASFAPPGLLRPLRLARLRAAFFAAVPLFGAVAAASVPPPPSAPIVAPASIAPGHPALVASDYVTREVLPDGAWRFDRVLDTPGRGYRWDAPGARVSFRTDACQVTALLRYNEKHISPSARAPVGLFLIDGRGDPTWMFTSPTTAPRRPVETVRVVLPVPPGGGWHDYAIVWPYGDAVDFCGLEVSPGAAFAPPAPRPVFRYLAFGDSITHGFTASHIGATYAYQLAARRGWQLLNLGFGGRTAKAEEGDFIGRQGADFITVFLGTNEWQGGVEPSAYQRAMRGLLAGIRRHQPHVPIAVWTALWVSPKWQPAKARYPLEAYRQALRELVAEGRDPQLQLLEGPSLIEADERCFDPILVHPNDAGFAQMAERLDRQLVHKR